MDLEIGAPVCIHYAPGVRTPGDGIMFVSDAGVTELDTDDFVLPRDELRSVKLVDPGHLAEHLHTTMVTRMLAAIEGAEAMRTVYLER